MGLARFEQETIINFNKEETEAHVFTYEITWQDHIEKRMRIKPSLVNGMGGKGYIIPKNQIPKPRIPKNLSDETRKAMGDRLRKLRTTKPKRKPE